MNYRGIIQENFTGKDLGIHWKETSLEFCDFLGV